MQLLRVLLAVTLAVSSAWAVDICDVKGFTAQQQSVVCYAGNFLTKMLTELNAGQNKTVEHVRVHLLPYLGGPATLKALINDSPDDAACEVCYADKGTSEGLTGLRNSLSATQLKAYDDLKVCYGTLTSRILWWLPQSDDGVFLVPDTRFESPLEQVVELFHRLYRSPRFNVASCRV
eukprot:Colp12_sorted_trinity150504_noHs@29660